MNIGNLSAALEFVTEYWSPQTVGKVNDQYVKVAKFQGEFEWLKHDDEDELFYVVYVGEVRRDFLVFRGAINWEWTRPAPLAETFAQLKGSVDITPARCGPIRAMASLSGPKDSSARPEPKNYIPGTCTGCALRAGLNLVTSAPR